MTKRIVAVISGLATFLLPATVFAQDGIVKCGPQQGRLCELKDLFELLVGIYNFLLGMAAIVAFAYLVWGGVQMILSSTDDKWLSSGKDTVKQALIGMAIILLAYVIVNTLLLALGVTGGAGQFLSGERFFSGGAQ